MKASDRDDLLERLVRDEMYRSPGIPTNRFGPPSLVSVTTGMHGKQTGVALAPEQWIVIDVGSGDVTAFAFTRVITPLPEFKPGSKIESFGQMTAREGIAAMRELWRPIQHQFFNQESTSAEEKRAAERMLDAVIPGPLQPWLKECCADFFDWLTDTRP